MSKYKNGDWGCRYKKPRGWYCSRRHNHTGPCALWPKFWRHPIIWWTWGKPLN